jgi:acetoin:2,6-dichlorophenolindophenol oxidoreductase subunit beta
MRVLNMNPSPHEFHLGSEHGIDCEVVNVRPLVPLDIQFILGAGTRTHRLFRVEEIRLCGWERGARLYRRRRILLRSRRTAGANHTPHMSPPTVDILEDIALPSVDRIAERVRRSLNT